MSNATRNHHPIGDKFTLSATADWALSGQVERRLIPELNRAINKAGIAATTIEVQGWMRHDSYADVSGLVFTTTDPARLTAWLKAWCDKQYEKRAEPGQPRRCTDWNSYYCLSLEETEGNQVWLKTSSYNIGD